MSCMLSLKTVANGKKEKLDFTYRCRYHSLAGEPTEKNSQALQQANFALVFTLLLLYPGDGLLCCTYIPTCLCESSSFWGGRRAVLFLDIVPKKE